MSSSKSIARRSSSKSRKEQLHDQQGKTSSRSRKRNVVQAGGVVLSLAGVLACNYLGLGLGRAVCHGLLVAALGAPLRSSSRQRVRV
ncbi:hypothetical protein [Pseudodesulfovibrio profundus]|uniref:hypothetical protein n=1 Tax=Pseudodesulfovibrio profundus TaxID=57320 RepID=UPI0012FFCEFB|nr:hypothetical protein [Pseudodesulfovibrio profundus]